MEDLLAPADPRPGAGPWADQDQPLAGVLRTVAHDLNSVLGVVSGCGEILRLTGTDPRTLELAGAIVEAAAQGAELTATLQALAVRPGPAAAPIPRPRPEPGR